MCKIYDKIKKNRNTMIVKNIQREGNKRNFLILVKRKWYLLLICQKSSIGFEIFISLIICIQYGIYNSLIGILYLTYYK